MLELIKGILTEVFSATPRQSHAQLEARAKAKRKDVAQRAYELYLQRGGSDGNDMADWLAAERELGAQ